LHMHLPDSESTPGAELPSLVCGRALPARDSSTVEQRAQPHHQGILAK
jgi:hypothetical protein